MEPKEAIKELRNARGNAEALRVAEDALEYRDAKRPNYKHGITGGYWHCPTCDSLTYPWGIRFCAGCGQRIAWGDEE